MGSGDILDNLTEFDRSVVKLWIDRLRSGELRTVSILKLLLFGDCRKAQGLENILRLCVKEFVYAAMMYV